MAVAKRPIFLNLVQIRLPVAGVMSILHRLSGVLLFLALPLASWLLMRSLENPEGWRMVRDSFSGCGARLLLIATLWALLHHLLAGIRYLLLDVHIGIGRPRYRYSAWAVLISAPLLAVTLGLLL